MKLVIFGVGKIYRQNRSKIAAGDEIVAFLDNNRHIQGEKMDGVLIYSPSRISQLAYDVIIIMSSFTMEMKAQLLNLGCPEERILHFLEYFGRQDAGKMEIYFPLKSKIGQKGFLVISTYLEYTGAPVTAVYAAMEMQKRGYETVVAAPGADMRFIEEFKRMGITFLLYPNLQYAKWEELYWVNDFHRIMVNTYPMILCAMEIGRHRDVMVWLHETDCVYPVMDFWKDRIIKYIQDYQMNICAVSKVAEQNFCRNVIPYGVKLLPYGIPDTNKGIKEIKEKITFAVIAKIHPIKQQLLFLEAVKKVNKINENCEFLIIGNDGDVDEYVQKVKKEAEKISNVCIMGELIKEELENLFSQIDIVVVTSSQEAMSLTATEAMMHGKVCIISDVAGMSVYVRPGENGFIFKSYDVDDLAEEMRYCIENKERLQSLGENARKTYDQFFTMDGFGDRLEDMLRQ